MLKRISRSTRSGKNDHIKIKADGPKAAGRGVWVMVFTFKLCVCLRNAPWLACLRCTLLALARACTPLRLRLLLLLA